MASFTRTALSHHSPTASFGSKPPPTDGDEAASFPMQRILPHRDVERGGVGEEEGEEEEESDEESEGEHAYDADGMQSRHSFDTKQQPAESDLRARILFGVVLALLFLVGLYMQLEVFDWHPVGVVSVVWTTPNSGFLHLAQWLVVRRLANIRFTHLRAVARSSQDQEDQEGREGSQQQRWQLLSNWTAEPSTSRPDNHSLPIIQVFVLDIVNERVDVSTMDASAGDPEPLDHALSKILHSSAYMSLPHLFYLRPSVYADRLFSLLDRSFDVHRFDWEPGQEGFHKHWPPSVFSTLVATEQQRLSLMAEAQERSDLMMHIAETMTADRAKDTSKEPPPAVHLISSESFRQHTLPAVIASARHVLRHLRVLPPVSQHPEVSRLLTKDSYLLSFQHTWYDHSEFLLRQVMTVAQAEVRPPEAMQLEWDRLRALESRAHERSLAVFPKEEVLPCLTCGDMTTPLVFEHDAFYADLLFSSEGLDSFDYIARNRVCAATGTIPEETYTRTFPLSGAPSGHTPEFDQNFHRIWNNDVRMNFYHQPSATNSIDRHADRLVRDEPQRCGLLSPTTLDLAREYVEAIEMSNRHCDLTIVTAITDCYDNLPIVDARGLDPSLSICALAILDSRTKEAVLQQGLHHGLGFEWYLQEITIPFEYLSSAKLSEISKTVAHRLFPMSRWIFWADGKGRINMKEALGRATTPFLGRPHDRKMETEVGPTLSHMRQRAVSRNETYFHLLEEARLTGDLVAIAAAETKWSEMKYAGQRIIDDIVRLHETYQAEGLYHRTKDLVIHDIVVQIYRPNVPCVWRILCGWFNEVNYLSFRGQLNLFVGAARENTTWMMSTTNNATALGDGHGHLRVC